MISKEAIIDKVDLPTEEVFIPEWDETVLVRGMTAGERDKYMDAHVKIEGTVGGQPRVTIANNEAMLAAKCLVDENGKRLFSDADAKLLAEKSSMAIHRISQVAERLSGLSAEDEASKNS